MTNATPTRLDVPLPTDLAGVPRVVLHLMAKNAESVVGRLLDCVLPHVQGVCLVLNDTTDATLNVVLSRMKPFKEKHFTCHVVTRASHPGLYFEDTRATYEEGQALAGESFDGPYTEAPLLADWAGARNVGWCADTASEYKLFLDADDVVADPANIPALALLMRQRGVDVLASRYTFGRGAGGQANSVSYRERLARNTPDVRWDGATHEVLSGGLRRVLCEDSLLVTDMKDNWGRGVRVPGRCFKVLYRQARLAGWRVTPRHLAYLVQECPGMMDVGWVESHLLPAYERASAEVEERAWVYSVVGEMHEARRGFAEAARHYRESVRVFPTAKAWFRLCRVAFGTGDYSECVRSYDEGTRLADRQVVLDDGPVYAESSKVLAAQACHTLGDLPRAQALVREAAGAFPHSRSVAALRDKICGGGT